MFILDSVLMTLIPEMGNTTDAGMIDGPPPTARPRPRIARPALDLQVPPGEGSNGDENGDDEGGKGRNHSPSQSSAITGVYVRV
jgi:hypothetical protein